MTHLTVLSRGMASIELHDAHIYSWVRRFFTYRRKTGEFQITDFQIDGKKTIDGKLNVGRGLIKPIYWLPDETSVLHCAHVDEYWKKFYTVDDIKDFTKEPGLDPVLIAAISAYSRVERMPDEVGPYVEKNEFNNPHHVTAAQVGLGNYVDMPPCWGDPDPNVIDVEMREVKEVPQLENNNGTAERTDKIRGDDPDVLGTERKD
ncbi:MAG: hypothetical protein P4L77_11030 [Sulfuriferula sp.]|nr:hypothetical protein [Sulfuriferula sp.]